MNGQKTTLSDSKSTHFAPCVKIAWTVIIALVIGVAYLQTLGTGDVASDSGDSPGMVLNQIQAEYLLGIGALMGEEEEIAKASLMLDVGGVNQRQRYMAFMIALGNPIGAKDAYLHLQADLLETGTELTTKQSKVQEDLNILAEGGSLPENTESLVSQLGWFGTLLEANAATRSEIQTEATRKVVIVISIFGVISLCCFLGFIGIIISAILAFSGKLKSSMLSYSSTHGVYAEVFSLWLLVFLALQIVSALLAKTIAPDNLFVGMICTLVAFFASMVVLLWARFRGVSWVQLRLDIGWTKGEGFGKECFFGFAGYAMMLPILLVGIAITMFLMIIQQGVVGDSDPFAGTGGGAHPIIVEIANGGWDVRILLLVLAAVAAPIVEETMFRGVLYRQLRSSSRNLGLALSITFSILITSFLFAAIHPQGWIAIPALMGIAIGMNLMREWRGTLIPSMMVHGISNGLVTTMMVVFLS